MVTLIKDRFVGFEIYKDKSASVHAFWNSDYNFEKTSDPRDDWLKMEHVWSTVKR